MKYRDVWAQKGQDTSDTVIFRTEKKQTQLCAVAMFIKVTLDGINSTALWHPNALISEISKLHNLPLQHRAIKGLVKRLCSKCNQAKQSYARMSDIMERGKIGLLLIANQYSNKKPFHSPDTPFFGCDPQPPCFSKQGREVDNVKTKHFWCSV